MKERLAAVRKALGLNQAEFAGRLGITRSALCLIEKGKNPLTEQNVRLVCLTYGVSELWLRSGEGEMFQAGASPYEREFFAIYKDLLPDTQAALLDFARRLLASQRTVAGR